MELSIRAPLCSTSYGLASLNIIKSLSELGCRVNVFPIGSVNGNDIPGHFHPSLQQGLQNAQYWSVDAPCVTIFHQFALAESVSRRRIGWPIFELDQFNPLELHHLRSCDELIVCSRWAKDVCKVAGLTQPVHVVPLGVDGNIFFSKPGRHERNLGEAIVSKDTTVFLSVGKKELRKCHDVILRCFEKAFSVDDNIELWMVWGNRILDQINPKESSQWTTMYQRSRLSSKIRLFEWMPGQEEVSSLMRKADCYLGLSRAEGWNLGLLEAMSCGLSCIANNYSGQSEYITKDNCMIIPFRQKEVAIDGIWFKGSGNWMEFDSPEEEAIVECMKEYHRFTQDIGGWFNTEGIKTAQKFSWENTARQLLECVQTCI